MPRARKAADYDHGKEDAAVMNMRELARIVSDITEIYVGIMLED